MTKGECRALSGTVPEPEFRLSKALGLYREQTLDAPDWDMLVPFPGLEPQLEGGEVLSFAAFGFSSGTRATEASSLLRRRSFFDQARYKTAC